MRKLNTPTIHWREIPLFRLLLPFLLGIYLGETFPVMFTHSIWFLLIGLIVLFGLSKYSIEYPKRWISGIFISSYLLLIGAYWASQFDERKGVKYFMQEELMEQIVVGQISSYPKETDKFIKAEFEILGQRKKEEVLPASGTLLVYFRKNNSIDISYGDQLVIDALIQKIPPPKNPLAFDYQRYCHYQNIHYQSFVKPKDFTIIKKRQAKFLPQTAYEWQSYFKQLFQQTISNSDAYGIVTAMLLGDRSVLSEEVEHLYVNTGIIHVLAVSGLHVGILSEVVFLLLGFFRRQDAMWKRWQWVLSLFVIWGFTLLVGSGASVTRAAIMFSFLNFGRLFRRNIHPLNSLAAAAFCILLFEPYALFHVGFQFSFLAVVGILIFYKTLYRFWMPKHIILNFFWQLLVVGVAAQIAVLPLSVYYFHQIPIYSWLAGLIAVPFASVILYGGLLLLLVGTVSLSGAICVGLFLSNLIDFQHQIIELIHQLPYAVWNSIWLERYEIFLWYGVVVSVGLICITKRVGLLSVALTCLILLVVGNIQQDLQKQEQLQLVIYDIPKKSVMDVVEGNKIYLVEQDSLTEKEHLYHTLNYRIAKADSIKQIVMDSIAANHVFLKEQYLQIGEKKIVAIDGDIPTKYDNQQRLLCDYIWLKNTPDIKIKKLKEIFTFELLIFDSSNNFSFMNQWEKECEQLNIAYHNTHKDGAFVVSVR